MRRKERWSFNKFFFLPEIVPKAVSLCKLVRARAVVVVANTAEERSRLFCSACFQPA